MNKSDLVDAVAGSADMSKAEAGRAVEAVLDGDLDALMEAFLQWQRSQRDSKIET